MVPRYLGIVLAVTLTFLPLQASLAEEEWWMLGKDDSGNSECKPPLEAEGVVLTPGEIMNRFEECKLMDETPSLKLKNVMVACEGNLNQVFIFSRTKEGCEELANNMNQ
jgi:hypothetical protein